MWVSVLDHFILISLMMFLLHELHADFEVIDVKYIQILMSYYIIST